MDKTNCVVILNYNDWETCVKLANIVVEYNSISNIIIVDNCSKDDSIDNLKRVFFKNCKVTIIENRKNNGYASGNHVGCLYAIQEFNAHYITIANPDVYFSEESLKNMEKVIDQNPDAGIVGCIMKCHSNTNLPIAWKLPQYADCILENLILLKKIIGDRTRYDIDYSKNEVKKVDALPGSFFLMTSEVYKVIGGFDTNTFLYYEENILAKKIKKNGYQNYLLTGYSYDHMHSVTINKSYKTEKSKLDLAYRSRGYYMEKYLKCNAIQMAIYKLTYFIGRTDYILQKKILSILKIRYIERNNM